MKKPMIFAAVLFLLTVANGTMSAQSKTYEIKPFEEVVISPHIEVVFEQAEREAVVIEHIGVDLEKLNVEVKGKTLHVYLEDAKVYTKSEKVKYKDYKTKEAKYNGTQVTAKVYYRQLDLLSLRGDEKHQVLSPIEGGKFTLKMYGELQVFLDRIDLDLFQATLYGEGYLEVKEGRASEQRIVSYGESEVNTVGVNNEKAKITSYGEGHVQLAVSEELKVTAYGEAFVEYKGDPVLNKGIIIGDAEIRKMY